MLPVEKYEAFSNISLGLYNHILIQFKDNFYKNFNIKKDTYLFSKITTKSLSPVGCFGSLKLHNFNLSYFDVGGSFAKELEMLPLEHKKRIAKSSKIVSSILASQNKLG